MVKSKQGEFYIAHRKSIFIVLYLNRFQMKVLTYLLVILLSGSLIGQDLKGAWSSSQGRIQSIWIVTENHFSITQYENEPALFISTSGGSWKKADGKILMNWEFDTSSPEKVGTQTAGNFIQGKNYIQWEDIFWSRVDKGEPGALQGAWLITGREREGIISERIPGARRTMKILSGTQFQWIAYNIATKEFFGTGGGSYKTVNGHYTEEISYFSRDNSRVGARLQFDFKLQDGKWYHSGKSSKGKPIYEIWSKRADLGI